MCLSCISVAESELRLEGRIWDVTAQKFISEKNLIRKFSQADYILLGLDFDNPHHHRQAAHIIERLTYSGRPPAILTGLIERHKQNAFAIFRQRKRQADKSYDATGLDMLLGDSMPDWPVARPVFDMAMLKNLPLKAVGLSRYEIGRLHRGEELPLDMRNALAPLLSISLQKAARTELAQNIAREFCGILPPEAVEKFMVIHRTQTAVYALSLIASPQRPTLLMAPANQIGKDSILRAMLKKNDADKKTSRLVFSSKNANGAPPDADFIWYTDGQTNPCGISQTN